MITNPLNQARHRAVQAPNPFEIELDPERKLWVPGRKKIFLPTPRTPTPFEVIKIDIAKYMEELTWERMRISFDFESSPDFRICDCVPGRAQYLGYPRDEHMSQSRETRPANPFTYGDITRSTTPRFRRVIDREYSNYRRDRHD